MNSFSLPLTEKRKQYELRALALRDFAGVREHDPLDPFALAQFAKLMVVDFDQVKGLSPESRAHLLGPAAEEWSGGACSRPLPDGWRIVILNPAHGTHRNRATLMEEISHVFLGHQPNRLAVIGGNPTVREGAPNRTAVIGGNPTVREGAPNRTAVITGNPTVREGAPNRTAVIGGNPTVREGATTHAAAARDYNKSDEEAAYAVGAAALVPYQSLRRFVLEGRTADQIARKFGVSRQLVEYRIKVTHLWADYKSVKSLHWKRGGAGD